MNSIPTASRKGSDYLLIAAFLALIMIPSGLMRPQSARFLIEWSEFRRAAPFPEIELRKNSWIPRPRTASLSAFPKGFEAWLNDRLRFRHRFIQVHSLAKVFGLVSTGGFQHKRGEIPGEKVLVGEEGWLYFSGERMAEEFTASAPFTTAELDVWATSIAARAAWLEQQGAKYVLFFAPNPQTIYPEFVPRIVGTQGRPSRLDQLKERLKGTRNLLFVDLRDDLIAAKSQFPTYQKTDTHWNDFGAWVAYRRLIEDMRAIYPDADPEPLSQFLITKNTKPSEGNLARMLNSPLPVIETEVKMLAARPRKAMMTPNKPLYGRIVECPDAPFSRAVVIHDSFYPYMTQFFEEHWQHLCSVWTLEFPADVVEEERPDVVIQEMVERKLMVEIVPNPAKVDAVLINRLADQRVKDGQKSEDGPVRR